MSDEEQHKADKAELQEWADGWDSIGEQAPEARLITCPITGDIAASNDEVLAIAKRLVDIRIIADGVLGEIRAELWKRSGGDDGPKTRTIAGSTLKAKLVAAEPRWNGLKDIAEKYPLLTPHLLTTTQSYRVSMREWAKALKTTSDDPAFVEMVEAIKKARQPDGLPSLKVEE